MSAVNPSTVTLLVLIPLIGWRVYARFRRMVGRQRLSKVRPWITLALFPLLILALGLAATTHLDRLAWLVAGLVGGSLLGRYGLAKTAFEATPQGLFYTPNAHLGIGLSLLLVARVVYRLFEVYALDPTLPRGMDDFARSPLTLAVFGLLAGYYVCYAIGLLRWRFGVLRASRERDLLDKPAAPPS